MKQIGTDLIAIPGKEKFARGLYWLAAAGLSVLAVNKLGPYVLSAINTLFDITSASLALAAVSAAGAIAIGVAWAVTPAIKTLIRTLAYRSLAAVINKYPIVQMHFEHQSQLRAIDLDRAAKTKLEEVKATAEESRDALQSEIDTLTAGARDELVSADTRRMSEDQLGGKLEEIKPYQEIIDFVSPLIETAELAINIKVRFANAFERDIAVQTARFNASEQIEVITGIWARNFSAQGSLERRNAEAARNAVFARWGAAKGRVNDMRGQMEQMVRAATMRDELAAAKARRYIEDAARTIEGEVREVPEVVPALRVPHGKPAGFIKVR